MLKYLAQGHPASKCAWSQDLSTMESGSEHKGSTSRADAPSPSPTISQVCVLCVAMRTDGHADVWLVASIS